MHEEDTYGEQEDGMCEEQGVYEHTVKASAGCGHVSEYEFLELGHRSKISLEIVVKTNVREDHKSQYWRG